MNEKNTDFREAVAIILMFEVGEFSILISGFSAQRDAWISVIVAFICFLPMLWVYFELMKTYEYKSYLDIIIEVFGNKIGKAIVLLYGCFCMSLVGYVLLDAVNFIYVTNLDKTPKLLQFLVMLSLSIIIVKKGIGVLGGVSRGFIIIVYGYLLAIVVIMGKNVEISNFQPILAEGIKPVLQGTFDIFVYPFGEGVVFLIVFLYSYPLKRIKKIMIRSLFFSSLYIFCMVVIITGTLGENYASSLTFTAYGVAKHLKIGFLKRSEILASISFIAGTFIKMSIYLFAGACCVQRIFELKTYKNVVTPIAFLGLNLILIDFTGVLDFNEWVFEVGLKYAFPFVTIFPVLALVVSKIKSLKKR